MGESEKLIALVGELVRENAQLRDLVKSSAEHTRALADPMQRTAKAAEEIASRENTVLWQMSSDISTIKTSLGIVREKQKTEPDSVAIKVWDRFAAASPGLRWFVALMLVLVFLSGWAKAAVEWALGK